MQQNTSGDGSVDVALANASTGHNEPLSFKNLPRDVTYRIMECLLIAEDVATKDAQHTRKYSFQVQVLRVCKDLHDLGISVFRLNHFLMVSIANKSVMQFVDLHLLHYFTANLKKFKDYSTRLHITSKYEKMKPHKFFIMCLTDVPVLVNALRECAFMYEQEMKLNFQLKPMEGVSMPVKQQRALLLPFMKLRGTRQTCVITGADATLAHEVSSKVANNVHWKRDQLRKYLEVLDIKRELADNARRDGYVDMATKLYKSVMNFIAGTSYTENMALQHNEPSFVKGQKIAFFEAELFFSQMDMSAAWLQQDLSHLQQLSNMPLNTWPEYLADWEAIHLQRMGVARLAYGYPEEAHQCFHMAKDLLLTLNDDVLSLRHCDTFLAATANPFEPEQYETLEEFTTLAMSFVPLLPPRHEPKPFVLETPTLAGLEQDLYDLKVLGYVGDLHEGQLKQKVGWSINSRGEEVNKPFDDRAKRHRDKQLAKYLAEDAECDAKGVPRPHRDVAVRTGRPEDDVPTHEHDQGFFAALSGFIGIPIPMAAPPPGPATSFSVINPSGGLPPFHVHNNLHAYPGPTSPSGGTSIVNNPNTAWMPPQGPLPQNNPPQGPPPPNNTPQGPSSWFNPLPHFNPPPSSQPPFVPPAGPYSMAFTMGPGGIPVPVNSNDGIIPLQPGQTSLQAMLAHLSSAFGASAAAISINSGGVSTPLATTWSTNNGATNAGGAGASQSPAGSANSSAAHPPGTSLFGSVPASPLFGTTHGPLHASTYLPNGTPPAHPQHGPPHLFGNQHGPPPSPSTSSQGSAPSSLHT